MKKTSGKEDFPGDSDGKASVCNVGDPGVIPRSGRSPGEGNDNPQKSVVFLYTNKLSERKIKKIIPFTIASEKVNT